MTTPTVSIAEKSTTVRPIPIGLRAMRFWLRLESRVLPASAERRAARIFLTPPRHERRRPSRQSDSPSSLSPAVSSQLSLRHGSAHLAVSTLGDGPVVLMIHGWGGRAADMGPLAGAFAQAGYRAVTFDMPGHGRSPGRESSLVEFLSAIRSVTRALGQPDLIVGHSFGGTAAVLGVTELGLPVRGAVLVAPAPGPAYYIDRFIRAVGLPPERASGMLRRVVERVGRSVESLDAIAAARDASVPALIVHDPADREVPWRFAEAMADAWHGSHLLPAPSLGHKRILRATTTIAAAIEFASALPSDAASRAQSA